MWRSSFGHRFAHGTQLRSTSADTGRVNDQLDLLILRLVAIPEPFRRYVFEHLAAMLDKEEQVLAEYERAADEQVREVN